MKNLLNHISILVMLTFLMVSIQSCSNEWKEVENAEVWFTATLPLDVRSRSFGEAEQINTLVVGVFDNENIEIYRESFPINGTSAEVKLALAQNQTYNFVFWAYDSSQTIYDIDDLTAIQMNTLTAPITFDQAEAADAFFAVMEKITVMGDRNYPVKLHRPLAQINVGTRGNTMMGSFTAKSAPDTFHPFTNTVSGSTNYTWCFSETTSETFLVDGNTYNYLTMCYVFAPITPITIPAILTLIDGETNVAIDFPEVEIEANNRSNIVGKFTVTE